MTATSYTTVIATRNRPDILALALPLHLQQTRLPDQILIIDSCDDTSTNQKTIALLMRSSPVPIVHQKAPKGISLQRNIGLDQAPGDVIFLPDDDSLLFPHTMEEMLRIYDRDHEMRVGGVCGIECRLPPPRSIQANAGIYAKRRSDRLKGHITPHINRIEDRHFPDPLKHAARRLMNTDAIPEWLMDLEARPVEWMTGFRMSFRRKAIQAVRFNELLGRYSLFEDVDAGLGVLKTGGLLVGAHRAPVYHHRSPENRSDGRMMGAIQILNRAYVTCRHSPADSERDQSIKRFSRFRLLQFKLMGSRNLFDRERYMGAKSAMALLPHLLAASPAELDSVYLDLRKDCLAAD